MVSWQRDDRLLTNLDTREANKQDGRPKKISVRQAEDMISKPIFYIQYSGAAPRDREPETLSTHSDADAPNRVKVVNVLQLVQKCTYTVMTGYESRVSVPEMHSGNSSQNCTYIFRSG